MASSLQESELQNYITLKQQYLESVLNGRYTWQMYHRCLKTSFILLVLVYVGVQALQIWDLDGDGVSYRCVQFDTKTGGNKMLVYFEVMSENDSLIPNEWVGGTRIQIICNYNLPTGWLIINFVHLLLASFVFLLARPVSYRSTSATSATIERVSKVLQIFGMMVLIMSLGSCISATVMHPHPLISLTHALNGLVQHPQEPCGINWVIIAATDLYLVWFCLWWPAALKYVTQELAVLEVYGITTVNKELELIKLQAIISELLHRRQIQV